MKEEARVSRPSWVSQARGLGIGLCLAGALAITLITATPSTASAEATLADTAATPRTELAVRSALSRRHRVLPDCVDYDGKAESAEGCDRWLKWKRAQESKRPKPGNRLPGHPSRPPRAIRFPAPPTSPQSWLETARHSFLSAADTLLEWAGGRNAHAADTLSPIEGALTTWTADDQLAPPDQPPGLGVRIFGKYDAVTGIYYLALKAPEGQTIGPHTTLWLDTDQNDATGLQVGTIGADYEIHVYQDSIPYLYRGEALEYVGIVESQLSTDASLMELKVPGSSIGVSSAQSIDLLGDVADVTMDDYANPDTTQWIYFPTDWTLGHYELPGVATVYPERTDFAKRVAMVFCEASQARFWAAAGAEQTDVQAKAYSQLYMALQHQAMMAGIPFDLISTNSLKNVANLVNYDALVVPYCANVAAQDVDSIASSLYQAVYHYHIGIVAADDLLTNDPSGEALGDAYSRMAQLLGLTRTDGGGPTVSLTVSVNAPSHPVMRSYQSGETILELPGFYWSKYEPLVGQDATTLAVQTIDGSSSLPAVLATETGGRNVHFSSVELLGNSNLAWQAVQWVLYGDQVPVGLKMGRGSALFAARADMDQSMVRAQPGEAEPADGFVYTDKPLLPIVERWKSDYGFVGSYYINVGDNQSEGEWTNWSESGPLYRQYVALGGEIGTHSLTHPDDTNPYDAEEHPTGYVASAPGALSWTQWLSQQFRSSMDVIAANVAPTWSETPARGGAVPGMPESLSTAATIMDQGSLDYLTGGYSGVGAGFPGAVGYLIPPSASLSTPIPSVAGSRVYFSPTMYFDFTLIEWGIPTGQLVTPPEGGSASSSTHTPLPATCSDGSTDCAEALWPEQYFDQLDHASQPVVVWPWHDYGPTISSNCTTQTEAGTHCYSQAMYTNVLAAARSTGAEFVTLMDAAERIATLKDASLIVDTSQPSETLVTALPPAGGSLGKFAVQIWPDEPLIISGVDNWYAYGDDKIFLPTGGGSFVAHLGTARDDITHISHLPMRAELEAVSGDGSRLDFELTGEGTVEILTQGAASDYAFSVDGALVSPGICTTNASNCVALDFETFGSHTGSVATPTPVASVTPTRLSFSSQALGTLSPAQTLSLSNTGSAPLELLGIRTTGDFAETNSCAPMLSAGAGCGISVTFTPTALGSRSGRIEVITNDPLNPTLTVELSGEGVATPAAPGNPTVRCYRYWLLFDACQVSWNDLSDNEQGFRIQYARNSSYTLGSRTATVGRNVTTATVSGLYWWTNYWFRVQAQNAIGDSDYVAASPSPVRTP